MTSRAAQQWFPRLLPALGAKDRLRFRNERQQLLYGQLQRFRDAPLPPDELPRWSWFDPVARRLVDTDIVLFQRYPLDVPEGVTWAPPDAPHAWLVVHRGPDETHEGKTVGRLDASILSPEGALVGSYERFAPAYSVSQRVNAGVRLLHRPLLGRLCQRPGCRTTTGRASFAAIA